MNHHVVAIDSRVARRRHVLPAERDGAALHGLAGQRLAVAVDHAVVVSHLAPGQHGAGVDDDAFEVVVKLQAQVQHWQAGLGGNRHGHVVGHFQGVCARELLFFQKFGRHAAQPALLGDRAAG